MIYHPFAIPIELHPYNIAISHTNIHNSLKALNKDYM